MLASVALDTPAPSAARSALAALGLEDVEVRRADRLAWVGSFHTADPMAAHARLQQLDDPEAATSVIELTDGAVTGIWAHLYHPDPDTLAAVLGWGFVEELVAGDAQTLLVGDPDPFGVIARGPPGLLPFYALDQAAPPNGWTFVEPLVAGPVHRAGILRHTSGIRVGLLRLGQNQS